MTSMTTPAANANPAIRRKSFLLAGTMVCAVGAATTLSNPFDFFSFSTSNPAVGTTAKKRAGGGLRASSSSQNFQRRLELASAEYTSGGVGDAPDDIVNFLSRYGLQMKDLELLAQLKGVQVDETESSVKSSTSTITMLGDSSTSSNAEKTSEETSVVGEETVTITEGGDETSTEDEAKSSVGFLSSFLSSSSATNEDTTEEASETTEEASKTDTTTTEEAFDTTKEASATTEEASATTEEATNEEVPSATEESYIEETASGSASPLDLTSLMSSYVAETDNEYEAEVNSQPEEPLSLESLMSPSKTTEPAPVETAREDDASPHLNEEQQDTMMQMMASGGMTPEQQQQLMEVLGQTAGG